MENIYLFKYNNYFNKKVLREETIAGYGDPLSITQSANFNPRNGIYTKHVINDENYIFETTTPDYCVVVSEDGIIKSRWYVIQCDRNRKGQYTVQLLRDLMAEYKPQILASKCFIRKGYVSSSSPLIFNNEDMGFNQIKRGHYFLENNLGTPWLVLYLARYNNENNYNEFSGSFSDETAEEEPDYVLESLSDYKYNYYAKPTLGEGNKYIAFDIDQITFSATYKVTDLPTLYLMRRSLNVFNNQYPTNTTSTNSYPTFPTSIGLNVSRQRFLDMLGIFNDNFSSVETGLPINTYTNSPRDSSYTKLGNIDGFNTLSRENGKKIKVGNQLYRIQVNQTNIPSYNYSYSINKNSDLGKEMRGDFFYNNGISDIPSNAVQDYRVYIPISLPALQIEYIPIQKANFEYSFTYTEAITKDSVYEILAAPYNNIIFNDVDGGTDFRHNGDIALQWFQNIINKYGGSASNKYAYDLQLVPYCPIDSTSLLNQELVYCYSQQGNTKSNYALAIKLTAASFSKLLTIEDIPYRTDAKLSNELDVYRLVSPNGVGEFEWAPAKNGGAPKNFEVDCTLIPYNPYIKINPYFGYLYGSDFNDYRGLICKGDFSLPIVSNEWESYKLSNKYYQDIFDRGIEYQEYNNKYQLAGDIINAVVGTAGGSINGAMAGGVGGAFAGGLASAAGGVVDVIINNNLRQESLDYQKDLYGYELGTIKARSQTLTRTTSYNINNRYFPYIEYYTCTEEEEAAFQAKLKYSGMTVGVIGSPGDYLNPDEEFTFIQADLIEIDIPENYEIAAEIDRILKGGIRFG